MKDPKKLELHQAYRQIPEIVLNDLRRLCNYENTTIVQSMVDGKIDPYGSMVQEGRRQIYLHVAGRLKEPPDIPEEGEENV